MNKNVYLFEVSIEGRTDTLAGLLSQNPKKMLKGVPHQESSIKLNVKFHGTYEEIQSVMSNMFNNEE